MPPTVLLPCVRCLGVERLMAWIIVKCGMLGSIVDTCSFASLQWLLDADHFQRECALFPGPIHVLVLFAQRVSTCTSFGSHFVGVLVLLEEYKRMHMLEDAVTLGNPHLVSGTRSFGLLDLTVDTSHLQRR